MSEKRATGALALVGYELQRFEEAIGLRITYGEPRSEPGPSDRHTAMLVLMPEEARELARDLLEIAEEIESADGAKDVLH